jgi:hypothetical protein
MAKATCWTGALDYLKFTIFLISHIMIIGHHWISNEDITVTMAVSSADLDAASKSNAERQTPTKRKSEGPENGPVIANKRNRQS